MSNNIIDNMDAVQEEIRELILHSKSKKRTIFDPCTEDTLNKYLKALEEEMSLYCIKYLFNPYEDLTTDKLKHTLVRVVNGTWELLMLHKEVSNNGQKLKDRNYALQQNNFYLNNVVDKQKRELKQLDEKLKQVAEEKRQLIVKMEASGKNASRAEGDAKRSKTQLASRENELITRLRKAEMDNAQMRDRFHAGIFTSKADAKDSYVTEYRAREKKYKESIAKLQENNRQLIQEVLNLKEELLEEDEMCRDFNKG